MYRFYLFILCLLVGMSTQLSAAEYQWLTFSLKDGTQIIVDAENLDITYEASNDGIIKLSSDKVNKSFEVASLISMNFTSNPTALPSIIEGDSFGSFTVFTLEGMNLGEFNDIKEAHSALGSGIYVMKNDTKTIKIIF